jgi:hypothetical protein
MLIIFMLSHFSAQGAVFIFKSGKSIRGEVRHEDHATIRIIEESGLEMTLRKSELNLPAMASLTRQTTVVDPQREEAPQQSPEPKQERKRSAKVYTNRDVRIQADPFVVPQPETDQSWRKSLSKLEREFARLQGACRSAGTGPNLSKILRSHTYTVNGKPVRITGYWADPANIEEAKQICARAIASEETLGRARRGYRDYLEREKIQHNSLTAQ